MQKTTVKESKNHSLIPRVYKLHCYTWKIALAILRVDQANGEENIFFSSEKVTYGANMIKSTKEKGTEFLRITLWK